MTIEIVEISLEEFLRDDANFLYYTTYDDDAIHDFFVSAETDDHVVYFNTDRPTKREASIVHIEELEGQRIFRCGRVVDIFGEVEEKIHNYVTQK